MVDWELEGFLDGLDAWIAQETTDGTLRIVVTEWVLGRVNDPYQGVQREPGFPNLWFGVVPGSWRDGEVVVCSYFIFEEQHIVRCDSFATLALPI